MALLKTSQAISTNLLPILVAVDGVLLLAHSIVSLTGTFPGSALLDLDREQTVGAWWSGSQLLLAGVAVGLAARSFADRSPPSRFFLWLLALGFVFLSLDEVASIHERLTVLSHRYPGWIPLFNASNGAWISIYAALAVGLFAITRKDIVWFWSEYRRPSKYVLAGAGILVLGAVVVEIAGYYQLIRPPALQVGLEEILEMVGGSVILFGTVVFFEEVQD